MKVLMATDGSKHAITAMMSTVELLRKKDLEADVLCIAPQLILKHREPSMRRGHICTTLTEQITKQSQRIVSKAHNMLHRQGLNAKTFVESGSPADEIIRRALDYDMVVVGAYAKYERKQPGLGPTSSLIVQKSRYR
jgi:nucleotide-binding universal stress UspA family protein